MLSVNKYSQKYINECRSKVAVQVSAYQNLVTTARNQTAADKPLLNKAVEAFEPLFILILPTPSAFGISPKVRYAVSVEKIVLKRRFGEKA